MNGSTCLYEVIEQECRCDGKPYTTYGIKLNAPSDSESICDISTDRSQIVRLVSLFNNFQLAECQFHDAVEDFMAAC